MMHYCISIIFYYIIILTLYPSVCTKMEQLPEFSQLEPIFELRSLGIGKLKNMA